MVELFDPEAATTPFSTIAALRVAHRELLDAYDEQDEDNVSDDFLARIERFQASAKSTGAIIAAPEDRAEVQSTINFWLTILLNSSRRPPSVILDEFDQEAARERMGDASPYKGLEPFQSGDAPSFFGRLSVVNSMVDRLHTHRLIAITGLSGAGKSSVVRAGLVPQLQEGAITGSEDWMILEPFVPGGDPLVALGQAAGRVIADPQDLVAALDAAGRAVVLTIDQFEEVYTLSPPGAGRTLFIDALVGAAIGGAYPHVIVITMRGEYDTNVVAHDGFARLFNDGRIVIGALTATELRAAIELPASQLGIGLESGLADELIARVLGEPAGLPLLQYTLLELWKRRNGGVLSWTQYNALGGNPRDILARRANEVFDSFGLLSDQDISRRIFTSLVQIGEGLEATSRRVSRDTLDTAGARNTVDRVLEKWRDNGLIRISPHGPIRSCSDVEVAHEALIRNWDRLVNWVEEAFASSRNRRALVLRAQRWKEGKEEPLGELALAEAADLAGVDPLIAEYMDVSRAVVAQRRQKVQARLRMIRWTSLVLILLVFVTMVACIGALISARQLRQSEKNLQKSEMNLRISGMVLKRTQRDLIYEREQLTRIYRNLAWTQCQMSHSRLSQRDFESCVETMSQQIADTMAYKARSAGTPDGGLAGLPAIKARERPLGFGGALPPGAQALGAGGAAAQGAPSSTISRLQPRGGAHRLRSGDR